MAGTDNLDDLEQLLAEFEASDLTELHVRHGDLEIFLSKDPDAAGLEGGASISVASVKPAGKVGKSGGPAIASSAAGPAVQVAPDVPDGAIVVRAPYLGTFYRAPKPGAPSYVEIGQDVSEETELCLVEVMKLFTAVRAGCSGKVVAILVDDGAMVSANQPLFAVMPA